MIHDRVNLHLYKQDFGNAIEPFEA